MPAPLHPCLPMKSLCKRARAERARPHKEPRAESLSVQREPERLRRKVRAESPTQRARKGAFAESLRGEPAR